MYRDICLVLVLLGMVSCGSKGRGGHCDTFSVIQQVEAVLRAVVLEDAGWAMQQEPLTITAFPASRSLGGIHDFYSEGDYWWPDPRHPDSPYVRNDGWTNPGNFTSHREQMIRFSRIVGALASAYKITGNEDYVKAAARHCRAWLVDDATRMNPSLLYAQAIQGRVSGRSIGIIDAIHLIEVARGLVAMRGAAAISDTLYKACQDWFSAYLSWVTTHPYGVEERDARNNHGTCWVMQVAVFASFTNNKVLMEDCARRYKQILLPLQMAVDGSFPLELSRTKPYGYALFNLDAMATICQTLSTPTDDLWHFETSDGRSIKKGIAFLYPFIEDKSKWPYEQDVMYWNYWPVAQPALAFGASAFNEQKWLKTWKDLDHAPVEQEVIRNLPVRHPLIWF